MNLRRPIIPKLKVGDLVKVIDINPNTGKKQFCAGKTGTITEINDVPKSEQKQYRLDFDNDWCGYYTRDLIELTIPSKELQEYKDFKISKE